MPTPNARNNKPQKLLERDITRTCREYLELRGWEPVRINAGAFGQPGMPDYVFLHYKKSRILWIEFKTAEGMRRYGAHETKQRQWHERERKKGATVLVVADYDALVQWYERRFGVEGQTRLGL